MIFTAFIALVIGLGLFLIVQSFFKNNPSGSFSSIVGKEPKAWLPWAIRLGLFALLIFLFINSLYE